MTKLSKLLDYSGCRSIFTTQVNGKVHYWIEISHKDGYRLGIPVFTNNCGKLSITETKKWNNLQGTK